jgi:hypothetical protein
MKIEKNMSLADLAQYMGSDATETDASIMRDLLVGRHPGENTADIDDGEWTDMLDEVAQ